MSKRPRANSASKYRDDPTLIELGGIKPTTKVIRVPIMPSSATHCAHFLCFKIVNSLLLLVKSNRALINSIRYISTYI